MQCNEREKTLTITNFCSSILHLVVFLHPMAFHFRTDRNLPTCVFDQETADVDGIDETLSSSRCFSSSGKVNRQTKTGEIENVELRDINVGDLVESFDLRRKAPVFSRVYLLEHRDSPIWSEIIKLEFKASDAYHGSISASPSHYIAMADQSLKRFSDVNVGDEILIKSGFSAVVKVVSLDLCHMPDIPRFGWSGIKLTVDNRPTGNVWSRPRAKCDDHE